MQDLSRTGRYPEAARSGPRGSIDLQEEFQRTSIVRTTSYPSVVHRHDCSAWTYTPPCDPRRKWFHAVYFLLEPASAQLQWDLLAGASDAIDRMLNRGAVAPLIAVVPLEPEVPACPRGSSGRNRPDDRELAIRHLVHDVMPWAERHLKCPPRERALVTVDLHGASSIRPVTSIAAALLLHCTGLRRTRTSLSWPHGLDMPAGVSASGIKGLAVTLGPRLSPGTDALIGPAERVPEHEGRPQRHWLETVMPFLFNERPLPAARPLAGADGSSAVRAGW
jgi:hypothetical protein